ncbi:hypothetical protein BT96DRAFT_937969 [Gymnopus androsaceus JB14]|uniref:Uncharacterized protein n=1 Tax=Gymnopus androsaceus JB14 TaxID=1447944 RepID=A0A6A4HUD4_9AGAR|nr:hypothetical protein BT96DRAFT_937969 [Gymnopus androsaceus JB14]
MPPSPPQSRSISTFTTSRIAARPRVIPLYATSISRRVRHPLFIHQNLPSKPYICVDVQPTQIKIPPIDILLSSSSDEPESPLTPVEEQASAKGDRVLSQSQPRVIMIPRPQAVTITTAGWSQAALKEYRRIARQAVKPCLDHKVLWETLQASNLDQAREHSRLSPCFRTSSHINNTGEQTFFSKSSIRANRDNWMKSEACAARERKEQAK